MPEIFYVCLVVMIHEYFVFSVPSFLLFHCRFAKDYIERFQCCCCCFFFFYIFSNSLRVEMHSFNKCICSLCIENFSSTFQVLAHDMDVGPYGDLDYSIKSGRGKGRFKVHPKTGVVYSQKPFQPGQEFDLMVSILCILSK